jgi:hypothetical protein
LFFGIDFKNFEGAVLIAFIGLHQVEMLVIVKTAAVQNFLLKLRCLPVGVLHDVRRLQVHDLALHWVEKRFLSDSFAAAVVS